MGCELSTRKNINATTRRFETQKFDLIAALAFGVLKDFADARRIATTQDTIESNILMRRSLMHYYNGEKEDAMKELAESEKLLIKIPLV